MSFYLLPNPYDPRYAVPDYVMAEPPGRGTFTTKGLRRGTIMSLIPDPLSGECGCKQRHMGDLFDPSTWVDAITKPKEQGGIPLSTLLLGAGAIGAAYMLPRKR